MRRDTGGGEIKGEVGEARRGEMEGWLEIALAWFEGDMHNESIMTPLKRMRCIFMFMVHMSRIVLDVGEALQTSLLSLQGSTLARHSYY